MISYLIKKTRTQKPERLKQKKEQKGINSQEYVPVLINSAKK